ncbi:O-antigen ligase family protein [Planktotalea sp.]|uniref:O-antigen ligase family protein n=1 Tax=Planktotalea sp. TaxID=2029877 RepID=UPI003F6BE04D
MNKEYCGIAVSVFLLGLFPVFFLLALQLILLVILVCVGVSFRKLDRYAFKPLATWHYLAFAQFYLVFLLNAQFYSVWPGTKAHFRNVAIESWGISLVCVLLLALWLHLQKTTDIKRAFIAWLPAGLTASFVVATGIYFYGAQAERPPLFTPSALIPPFWYLVLTMVSFVWFFEMSLSHKIWRLALFFFAGVMTIYGAARFAMLAWLLCGIVLIVWCHFQIARRRRVFFVLGASLGAIICVAGIVILDSLLGGVLSSRMQSFSKIEFTFESIGAQFLRLKIWAGATSVISDNLWLGVGQINERIALRIEMDWDRWLRAHQTYFSYLIAGGIPTLLSGVMMQSPTLSFLRAQNWRSFVPAFLGLGVVVTLNCFTDSLFQSAVNVQAFMLITVLLLKAKEA